MKAVSEPSHDHADWVISSSGRVSCMVCPMLLCESSYVCSLQFLIWMVHTYQHGLVTYSRESLLLATRISGSRIITMMMNGCDIEGVLCLTCYVHLAIVNHAIKS